MAIAIRATENVSCAATRDIRRQDVDAAQGLISVDEGVLDGVVVGVLVSSAVVVGFAVSVTVASTVFLSSS